MTALVSIPKDKPTKVSLLDLAERVARQQIAETRTVTSSRKARVAAAKEDFKVDPLATLGEIQRRAQALAEVFDATIIEDTLPLSQAQINTLSNEYLELDKLRVQIEALEDRYRSLIYGHLDEVVKKVAGRPASQTPGKVEAEGPGPRYFFERRGGGRANPELDAEGLRRALPPELVVEVYKTVHHDAKDAWDEEVFDEGRFEELVKSGQISLDLVANYLTPGEWRTPSFYKTLVDGDK